MDFGDVERIGLQLPEATVGTSYGTPALLVRGKSFCRLWSESEQRSKGPVEGEVLVVFCDLEAKDSLIEASGGVLFDQEHYSGYAAVLVRLIDADDGLLEDVLEDSYRIKAPKTLVRKLDS